MKITAIILAAGLSRRMKRNKLNLLVEGETMLQRVYDAAAEAFDEIILVRGEEALPPKTRRQRGLAEDEEDRADALSPAGYRTVINPRPEEGIAGSIALGLRAASPMSQGFVFLMGDQPFLQAKTLLLLKERFAQDRQRIVRPVYDGCPGGPVFFPAALKEELLNLSGDTGGRQVMARHPELILDVPLADSKEALDLDSPGDYAQAVPRRRVLVKGAGDVASGVILALYQAGFEVIATERENPSCIRAQVSFASCLREGSKTISGITAVSCRDLPALRMALLQDQVPVLVDPKLSFLAELAPDVFVDAVIAKGNTGTTLNLAPLVIALGPGFRAGVDCHAVIETMRGPHFADIITEKNRSALPNTGTPGLIAGQDVRRVIHAPATGILRQIRKIGDIVAVGETIAIIGETEVKSKLHGTLRGLIQDGFPVKEGLKIADVDPRSDPSLAFTISDKAAALGQAVVQAILLLREQAKPSCP